MQANHVNREYIKSQIDTLPDEILIGVNKYINKKIKQKEEIDKHNAEYLAKLDLASKEIKEGNFIGFEIEELEAMQSMQVEKIRELAEKAKIRTQEDIKCGRLKI